VITHQASAADLPDRRCSMGGQGTRVGLETMANYAASEFQRLGLEPGGENETYFQRYPIEVWQSFPDSSGVWAAGRATASWKLGADFVLQGGRVDEEISAGVTLVAGDPVKGIAVDSQAVARQVVLGIRHTPTPQRAPSRSAAAAIMISLIPSSRGFRPIEHTGEGPEEEWTSTPDHLRRSRPGTWLGQVGIGASACSRTSAGRRGG
jgi:hypothetical protein